MAQNSKSGKHVSIEPPARDAGYGLSQLLDIREAKDGTDPNFAAAVAVYSRAFPPGPSVVDPTAFARSLSRTRGRKHLHYHFWAVAERSGAPAHGMAAFFAMRTFGFGGYIALEPPLGGRGLARVLLGEIEAQMSRDEPALREWYIECDPGSVQQRIFEHLGFERVPVSYRQPQLMAPSDDGTRCPELTLMRKGLGGEIPRSKFSMRRFRPVLRQILRDVYRISDPEESLSYRQAIG